MIEQFVVGVVIGLFFMASTIGVFQLLTYLFPDEGEE